MRWYRRLNVSVLAVSLAIAAPVAVNSASAASPTTAPIGAGYAPWVQQIGTYDSLISPNYDGLAPIRDVLGKTTIGLGTFSYLNGEMVILGGAVYRVGTDGKPKEVSTRRETPFMQSVRVRPEFRRTLPTGLACADLIPRINRITNIVGGVVAVRLRGQFADLVTRSVPAQQKPYPSLADVTSKQTVFPLGKRNATLVGFRTGPDMAGVGPVGLHLHGLTNDRLAGGHVLSCATGNNVQLTLQTTRGARVHN